MQCVCRCSFSLCSLSMCPHQVGKIKGTHYAIKSGRKTHRVWSYCGRGCHQHECDAVMLLPAGMVAAEAIFPALTAVDASSERPAGLEVTAYEQDLRKTWVYDDLWQGKLVLQDVV